MKPIASILSLFNTPKEPPITRPADSQPSVSQPPADKTSACPKKIIALGAAKELDKYYRIFGGLDDLIHFCIDDGTKTQAHGHQVFKPELLRCNLEDYDLVLFAADSAEKERFAEMAKKYSITEGRIISAKEWAIKMLVQKALFLRPTSLRIDSSTLCQLDCADCYMRLNNSGAVGNGYLKFEHFQKLMLKNPFIRNLELSNSGEPFLNPDIIKILEFAHKMRITVSFGNGSNFNTLSDELLEALVKYVVKSITLSIDGASQEVYEVYRKKGNFDKVIDNIKKLNAIKAKYKSDLPRLTWQYILMKHNEKDAYKAKEIAKELGIDIRYKLDWSGGFTPEDPKKLEELTGLKVFNRRDFAEKTGKNYMTFCKQMLTQPVVNWDGRVLGCCTVYKNDWKLNVFDSYDLAEVLNSDPYRKNVEALLTGKAVDEGLPCAECKFYKDVKADGSVDF